MVFNNRCVHVLCSLSIGRVKILEARHISSLPCGGALAVTDLSEAPEGELVLHLIAWVPSLRGSSASSFVNASSSGAFKEYSELRLETFGHQVHFEIRDH